MLPVALPVEAAENFAVNEVFCPAPSAKGTDNPLILNPVPDALAAEIEMLDVPEFVSVMLCDPLLPTRMLPKLTLGGLAESCPWIPVPPNEIVSGELEALLRIVRLPVIAP